MALNDSQSGVERRLVISLIFRKLNTSLICIGFGYELRGYLGPAQDIRNVTRQTHISDHLDSLASLARLLN